MFECRPEKRNPKHSLFDCLDCKCVFHTIEELALHCCSAAKFTACPGCGKHFTTIGLLALHKCSNKVSYECDICQDTYYDVCEFVLHDCLYFMPLICYDCETMFPEISALALHRCTSDKKRIIKTSSKVNESASMAWSHLVDKEIRSKPVLDNFKSSACELASSLGRIETKKTSSANSWMRRTETIANVCDESLQRTSKTSVNKPLHTSLNPLQSMKTNSHDSFIINKWKKPVQKFLHLPLTENMSVIEEPGKLTIVEVYKCAQCDEMCFNKSDLDEHKKIHNKCDICHCTFSSAQELLSHKKFHTVSQLPLLPGTKPVIKIRNDLNTYNKGFYKKFRCLQCNKIFHNRIALKRHTLINNCSSITETNIYIGDSSSDSQKPLSVSPTICDCNFCNLAYPKSGELKEVKYACNICSKSFICIRSLYRHKRFHKTYH